MKAFSMSKTGPIVETPKGKLRGFHYDGVDHFYGIRYEKQPIGQFGSKDSTIENNEVKP